MSHTNDNPPNAYRCRCGGKVERALLNEHDPGEMQLRWHCSNCDQYFGFPWLARQWEYPESGTVLVGFDPWEDEVDALPHTFALQRRRVSVGEVLRRAVPATIISTASLVIMVNLIFTKTAQALSRTLI